MAPGGYRWWYLDAVSDDARHALTVIAFVGSVFSPYYRYALRGNPAASPEHYCAINVCLYSPGAGRWTMTERGARHVQRTRDRFTVGPSHWQWRDGLLEIGLQEWSVPIPRPVRGTLRVRPRGLTRFHASLDAAGRHRWGPIAPSARIEVEMQTPALRWSGDAYVDSNEGDEPIGQAFERWDWLRTLSADGSTAVVYDVQPRASEPSVVARHFRHDGSDQDFTPAARQSLPTSRIWRVDRQVRADGKAHVLRTLEDTPFYARSLLQLDLDGSPVTAVHETLDGNRLEQPIVQAMLPWRMPRRR